jgi:putative ABC transport system substrate-binding protein
VERGALFSVFPDHRAIGRRLARRLTRILAGQGNDDPPLEAVREVKLVVNLRTLEHLGIRLSNEERERIELTFPDR